MAGAFFCSFLGVDGADHQYGLEYEEPGDILEDCRGSFSNVWESEQDANAETLVGKNTMSRFPEVMNTALRVKAFA